MPLTQPPWHRPLRREIEVVATDDDDFLTLEQWPREVFAPHQHDGAFNWLVPLRPGRLVFEVEGAEVDFSAEEWLCIFPRTAHRVVGASDNLEVLSLFVPEEAMFAAYQACPAPPPLSRGYLTGPNGMMAQGFALKWGEYRFGRDATSRLEGCFGRFLCGWLWEVGRLDDTPGTGEDAALQARLRLGPAGEPLLERLKELLSRTPFPWDEVAAGLGLSRRSLQRRLMSELGLSPAELLSRLRIDEARRRLSDPTAKLADVALACGFASQAHFSFAFKQRVGCSPGEYRRRRAG